MFDSSLREVKELVLLPLANQVSQHTTPIGITLTGLGVGALAALAGATGMYGIGLVLWLINRTLDGLDGTLARITGQQTDLGGYIDIMVDHVVYAGIPAALVLGHFSVENLLALVFMLATFYVNAAGWMYLGAILEQRRHGARERGEKTTVTMPTGLIEGMETVIFYGLFFVFPAHLAVLFTLMGGMVIVTICQRLLWAHTHLR